MLEADGVVAVPAYLSDAEAAAASVAAVTAWQALVIQGHLKAGETVLVEGTGGVSLFALQFATAAGARVIVTSSSDAKIARALELGAWHGVNYVTEPDWGQAVLELTAGEGVDHVIENAGDLGQSVDALRPGGLVSLIGYLSQLNLTSADPPSYRYELDIVTALLKNVRLQGISAAPRESYESMFRAMETSELRPVIDRRYDLANAIDALVSLRDEGAFGKICIDIG